MTATELPLRIVLVSPPKDVMFAIQEGKVPVRQTRSTGKTISFDLTVQVKEKDRELRLLGAFAQGPPTARFVYVNSGTLAGSADSCWTRRAKVSLMGIERELVEKVTKTKGAALEARIEGKAKDGGPACASVPLLDGWKVVRTRAK